MRKLFSFRSSGSISGTSNHSSPTAKRDTQPLDNRLDGDMQVKAHNRSSSQADSKFGKENHRSHVEVPLRRSFSCSSSNAYNDLIEKGLRNSPLNERNILHTGCDCENQSHSFISDGLLKPTSGEKVVISKHVGDVDWSASLKCRPYSSGSSICSSPVPLRCQAPPLTNVSNRVLDLYIDGEQEEQSRRLESESPKNSSASERINGCLQETRLTENLKRPPRFKSKGAIMPVNGKEQLMSHSIREVGDKHICTSPEWERRYSRPSSPEKIGKSVVEKLTAVCPPVSKLKSFDVDFETSTAFEDIFVDHSDIYPDLSLNKLSSNCFKPDASYELMAGQCLKESSGSERCKSKVVDWQRNAENEHLQLSRDEQADAELEKEIKEAEERTIFLAGLQDGQITTRNILAEVKNLAFELSNQLKIRKSEKISARKAIRVLEMELNSKTWMLEKEKQELQFLEEELDRRSKEWLTKLDKYQSEEQRLRERVRELAEQNVSIQREISLHNTRDVEDQANLLELESQLNNTSSRLEEIKLEKCKLQDAVVELQDRAKHAESDLDCLRRRYKEKDVEVKDLQKALCNFQRVNTEQEKAISGLRKDLLDGISGQCSDTSDGLGRLLKEVLRLGAIEQNLKQEIESYKREVDSLRHENISLLNRFNGGKISSFRLDQELHSRMECFINQSFSLHDSSSKLCGDLLEFVKVSILHGDMEHAQEVKSRFDGYSLIELDMKVQNMRRGMEEIKRGWKMVSTILQEKDNQDELNCLSEVNKEEADMKNELKTELLLSRALRDKLLSQDIELNQHRSDLAASIRGIDILRCELQQTRDAISCLTHQLKDAELQMMKKNDSINQLENNLLDCQKELNGTAGVLTKVSEERNALWAEVKQLSEKNMQLDYEMGLLRKKVESLEEDILVKEGQISILKDSIKKKPFDILYDPNSTEEFVL